MKHSCFLFIMEKILFTYYTITFLLNILKNLISMFTSRLII